MNSGKIVIQAELDTKSFETQIAETEKYLQRLEKSYSQMLQGKSGLKQNEQAMANLKLEIEKTTNKLVGLRQKQEELNSQGFKNVQSSLSDISSSMKGIINSVVRWGLAIFGIRTAYNLVRNAMATITSQDEQLSADIEYMKNVLAYMLEPVVRSIVNLMKQLMFYVGYIAKAWFGVDIYSKASAKAMEAGTKSAKATTKELNKQLAKFDEMNVLQSSSAGGGDTGGGGGATPSFDLSKSADIKVPKWLQWIVDHKDEILAFLAGVAIALVLIKLGIDGITATGIGLIVAGLVYSITNLLKYLDDPKWEYFGKIIIGIGVAIVGLAIAIESLPVAVVGAIVIIYGIIIAYWDKIREFFQKGVDWLTEKSDFIHEKFGDTIGNIYDTFVGILGKMLQGWDNTFKAIKRIFDDVIKIVKAVLKGDWKTAWEGAKDIVATIFDTIVKNIKLAFSAIWDIIKVVGSTVGDILWGAIKGAINGIMGMVEDVINSPIRAINSLISVINKVPGISIGRLSTFSLPRLAQGGIVNNPGQGVMMGNYIAGERGAEAVLPLTDDTLQRLANMIPITVNLTNTMNGRVISRELVRTQNEQDFAFNR